MLHSAARPRQAQTSTKMKQLNSCLVFLALSLTALLLPLQTVCDQPLTTANSLRSRHDKQPRAANLEKEREPRKAGNSRRISYCNDQAQVIAGDEERDSQWDSLRGSVPVSQFRCPYKSGRYGRRGNCHSYYQCTEDKACLGLCPPAEVFDVRSGQCVPEGGGAGGNGNSSTCYQEEPFSCPKKSGVFRHERRCDRFFKCRYGLSYVVYCRSEEKFDIEVQRCVPQGAAVCEEVIEEQLGVVSNSLSANDVVSSVKHLAGVDVASVAVLQSETANCSCQ